MFESFDPREGHLFSLLDTEGRLTPPPPGLSPFKR